MSSNHNDLHNVFTHLWLKISTPYMHLFFDNKGNGDLLKISLSTLNHRHPAFAAILLGF